MRKFCGNMISLRGEIARCFSVLSGSKTLKTKEVTAAEKRKRRNYEGYCGVDNSRKGTEDGQAGADRLADDAAGRVATRDLVLNPEQVKGTREPMLLCFRPLCRLGPSNILTESNISCCTHRPVVFACNCCWV